MSADSPGHTYIHQSPFACQPYSDNELLQEKEKQKEGKEDQTIAEENSLCRRVGNSWGALDRGRKHRGLDH